jgi:cyclophilin family peptidyl-prolyl cis-trans isomerase
LADFFGVTACSQDVGQSIEPTPVIAIDPVLRATTFDEEDARGSGGTVGTSTRGCDTGDGQIFINLVDNLQLDHDFTVFGEVVSGMDVADQVAEGDVIVRATVVVE